MTTPDRSVKEVVAEERRRRILEAATAVFAEKGFQRSTIREVARAAGVADGTIYNYFPDKTGLLFAILHQLNQSESRDHDLSQTGHVDLRTFFRAYLKQRFDALSGTGLKVFQIILSEVLVNPDLRRSYVEQIVRPTYELAERHFGRLQGEGRMRPLDTGLTVRAISAVFLGVLVLRVLDDPVLREGWEDLPELMTTLLLDGLAPDEKGAS